MYLCNAINNIMNRITTHPGDVLKEELEVRGISQKKFAEALSLPYTQLNEILNGKRPVTTDFALMMEAALGINPELLINMQTRYNMSVARQKKPLLERLIDIRKICAALF
ncbi:MAG: HigA family addiction module antidote protein [Bacteroidaceae bacterium]|nr:HigA family addiction module antidote protein [Bacteroidaceae bacterium]MBR1901832.1 HigA family addiction module antidote protein [Bacteroidaceae bacterium]